MCFQSTVCEIVRSECTDMVHVLVVNGHGVFHITARFAQSFPLSCVFGPFPVVHCIKLQLLCIYLYILGFFLRHYFLVVYSQKGNYWVKQFCGSCYILSNFSQGREETL